MNLDESQKKKVSAWIEEGLKLSEIQDKLTKELGLKMTYMEVRFLIDDLGVKLKDKAPEPAPAAAPANVPAAGGKAPGQPAAVGGKQAEGALTPEEPGAVGGGVSVTVDQITRPGALVSGKVTFSDGKG